MPLKSSCCKRGFVAKGLPASYTPHLVWTLPYPFGGARIEGRYFIMPAPTPELVEPSIANLMQVCV